MMIHWGVARSTVGVIGLAVATFVTAPSGAPPVPPVPVTDGYVLTKDSTVTQGCKWAPNDRFAMWLTGNSQNATVGKNVTRYFPLQGGLSPGSATADFSGGTRTLVPRDGTVMDLYILEGASHVAGDNVYTMLYNGVATALEVTLSGATQTGNNVADSFAVVAGDEISLRVVTSADASNVAVKTAWAVTISD